MPSTTVTEEKRALRARMGRLEERLSPALRRESDAVYERRRFVGNRVSRYDNGYRRIRILRMFLSCFCYDPRIS